MVRTFDFMSTRVTSVRFFIERNPDLRLAPSEARGSKASGPRRPRLRYRELAVHLCLKAGKHPKAGRLLLPWGINYAAPLRVAAHRTGRSERLSALFSAKNMMAARRSSFSNVLGNLFLYVEPVILSGHGRKRRKDFTDCAQGNPHSLAPLTGKKPTIYRPLHRSHPGTAKWHDDCCNDGQSDQ
jgi:hypothetical protein